MQLLFRVRDKNAGRIIDGEFALTNDGRVIECQQGYYGELYNPCGNVNVEFWTGLTDRNGVKIFEGDRVKYKAGSHIITGKITWDLQQCRFLHDNLPLSDDNSSFMEVLNDPI